MSAKVSLNIKSSPDALGRMIDAIESISLQEEWPPDLLFTINLVIEELGLNIMNHAYGGDSGEFEIVITSEDKALTVELIDSGPPFNMLTDAPIPDVEADIQDRPIGGLGIHLVKTMMDELNYKREQEQNHLILVKRRDK
ncbi:MAG: ATP-binding protein [Chloroflexi bacterium]|nr:ATP-binding protein [Chloroflexota bacterium]